jgi:4-hydroxybenzoate polyprenyltransferase
MRRVYERAAPILKLSRVTSAFAAIANVWFVILWVQAHPIDEPGNPSIQDQPLWLLLVAGAATAFGLYAFGAGLNDVLDARRDRTLRPDRPIPSGGVGVDTALLFVLGALLLAILGAVAFERAGVLLTITVACAIVVFNAAARFVPAVGLVLIGLIYAGHMLVPNPWLVFVWPVWLVMTHAMGVGLLTHTLGRKVPKLSQRALFAAGVGWIFWSLVLLWIGAARAGVLWPAWVRPGAAIPPVILALAFGALTIRRLIQYGGGPRAADKIGRYGSLWLGLYGAGWLLGQGITNGAAILGLLVLCGYLGMTLLREMHGLAEQPMGYRR